MPGRVFRMLGSVARRLRARREPPAVVLLYHRVAAPPCDPQLLCVAPERFEAHLAVLAARCRPLSLEALLEAMARGRLPERAVAVTFDDGYADNLESAKPLLERHGVPATVYVTTGHTGSREEFWWDELERLLLLPRRLPATLRLAVAGRDYAWSLGRAADLSAAEGERLRDWTVLDAATPTPRHGIYRALHRRLRRASTAAREEVIAALRAWVGVDREGRTSHRALDSEGVRELARGGVVSIGAHTETHPVLASIPPEQQRLEIERSRDTLAAGLGAPPRTFAYPFGGSADFTPATAALVRAAGFDAAVTTAAEPAWPDGDRFRIPRFLVRNWDRRTFEHRLERFFRGG
jgi:peptidoglycan/xylan/chitin deacetylase (PgdA/CDA1 family)